MRKLANILFGVIIFVVAFTVARQAVKYGISEFNEYSNQTNFKKDTIESIKKLNNKTPIIVDENTKITEVKLEDDVIIYTTILGGIDYDSINIKQFSKSQKITNIFFLCQKDCLFFFTSESHLSFCLRNCCLLLS